VSKKARVTKYEIKRVFANKSLHPYDTKANYVDLKSLISKNFNIFLKEKVRDVFSNSCVISCVFYDPRCSLFLFCDSLHLRSLALAYL